MVVSVVPVVVGPVLQSILMTGKEGVAVVDGNMVRKGDKVGDYRVAKIEPHAVTLAITRTKSVTVGKAVKQESTEEVKELHFPEYYDVDMPAAKVKVASTPGTAAPAPEQKPNQAELEQNYKQILEKLKL